VNPARLRFVLTRLLNQEPGIDKVQMLDPVPGESLKLDVTTNDPFASGPPVRKAQRKYRITIEEID
jgi:hypothetical protein